MIHTQKTPVKAHAQARVARLVIVFDIRVHGLYADVRINCTYLFVSMVLHLSPLLLYDELVTFFNVCIPGGLLSFIPSIIMPFSEPRARNTISRGFEFHRFKITTVVRLGIILGASVGGDRALTFVYCVSSALYCEHPFN